MKKIPLQITFLDTGTGMPLFPRRPASVLCETPAFSCLLDMGPGIYHRLVETNVNPFSISYICFTHFHVAHTANLAVFLVVRPF